MKPHGAGGYLRSQWVRFGAAVAAISGPTAIGSIISFLSTPIFVYWFPPQQFGELGFALAFASILSSLVSLRLELLVFRETPDSASHIAAHAVLVVVIIATLIFAAVALLALIFPLTPYFGGFSPPEIIIAAYVLTVTICIANIGSAMCVAQFRYLASALPRTLGAVATLIFAATFYFSPFAELIGGGLLAANLAAQALAAGCYVAFIGWPAIRKVRVRSAIDFVRQHWSYIRFAAPQNCVASAGFLNSAIMFVGYVYGPIAAGQVFFAFRLVGFPSTVIGVAAGNVFSNEAWVITKAGLRKRFLMMTLVGLVIYVPLSMLGIVVPERLLPVEWHDMLHMIAPISLLCGMHFISGSFGQLLLIWNRTGSLFVWDCARLIFTTGAMFAVWGWWDGDSETVIWWFVAAQSPFYLWLAAMIYGACDNQSRGLQSSPPPPNSAQPGDLLPPGDCSVVIPVHNRPDKLARALIGATLQGDEVKEIIVVDDASSEDNAARIRDIVAATPKARLLRQDANTGAARARNNGVAASSGSWIAFLDSDDWWRSGRIAAHRHAMSRSGIVASYNPAYFTSGGMDETFGKSGRAPPPRVRFAAALAGRNFLGGCSFVCVRRSTFDAIGGFDPDMPSCQDWDLWLRLAQRGEFAFVPEVQGYFDVGPHQRISTSQAPVLAGHVRMNEKARAQELSRSERRRVSADHLWTDAEIAGRFGNTRAMLAAMARSFATRPSRRALLFLCNRALALVSPSPHPAAKPAVTSFALRDIYDGASLRMPGPGAGHRFRRWAEALMLSDRLSGLTGSAPAQQTGPSPARDARGEQARQFRHNFTGAREHYQVGLLARPLSVTRRGDPRRMGNLPLEPDCDGIDSAFLRGLGDQRHRFAEELTNLLTPVEIGGVCAFEPPQVAIYVDAQCLNDDRSEAPEVIAWHLDRLDAVRRATGNDVRFVLFSDASEDRIAGLLAEPDVWRQAAENPLVDMLGMARASALIWSGAGIGRWAAFIGMMPALHYPAPGIFTPGESLPEDFIGAAAAHRLNPFERSLRARFARS